jgi:hypothetical protein
MGFLDDMLDDSRSKQYVEQGTEAWTELRRGRFTSSEIYHLMTDGYRDMTESELKARPKTGKGSSTTRIYVPERLGESAITYIRVKVAEILTGTVKQDSYAFPMVRGSEMEPEAVAYFEQQTGLQCEEVGFVPFGDYAGGSPDRYVGENEILEVKCPWAIEKQIDYLELTDQWDLKRYSPEYYWQCMANLFFTQKDLCHFITYDPRYPEPYRMTHITIKPDLQAYDLLAKKIEIAVKEMLETLRIIQESGKKR